MNQLVPKSAPRSPTAWEASAVVPRMIANAGEHASRRFLEFFAATIRNKNTREAYYRAVCRFFAWCDDAKLGELADIEPLHVAAYIEVCYTTMRSRPLNSTLRRSACASTGSSPARFSP